MFYPDIDPTVVRWKRRTYFPLQQRRLPMTHIDQGDAIAIAAGATAVFIEGVGAARREKRPWLDVVLWVHAREVVGRHRCLVGSGSPAVTGDRFAAERAFLNDHRPWEVADVVVSGELGQPARDGRYGNVVTVPGPARVAKIS